MTDKERVEKTARAMVQRFGLINLSRAELCSKAGIPNGSFTHVMGCTFTEFTDRLRMASAPSRRFRVDKTRVDPTLRQSHILSNAIKLAESKGYSQITQAEIAEASGVSRGLVQHYFGTMRRVRRRIMIEAVRRENLKVIAQGLAAGDRIARDAPEDLRQKAARLIAEDRG